MNKRVRHVFVIPRDKNGLNKITAYFKIFKHLFNEHYDLLAQFSNDWRGAFLARLLKVDIAVSRKAPRRGSFWHNSFNYLAPELDHIRPMAEQDVDLLRCANIYKKSIAPAYELAISSSQKNKLNSWAHDQGIDFKNKLIVIHGSSRWKFKEIPLATWASIIDELKSKKINIVLSGSQEDLKTNELIFNLCALKPILAQNFSLHANCSISYRTFQLGYRIKLYVSTHSTNSR